MLALLMAAYRGCSNLHLIPCCYQRLVTVCPGSRERALQDAYGGPLTFSGGNSDTLMLALLRAAYSGRSDTHLVASMEQALPLQPNWLNFNRFCVRAEGSAPIFKGLRAHVSGKGDIAYQHMHPQGLYVVASDCLHEAGHALAAQLAHFSRFCVRAEGKYIFKSLPAHVLGRDAV